jgi:hypothetical protein
MLIDQLATSCCVRYWTLWIQESQNYIAIAAPPIIHPSVPNTTPAAESEWRLSRKILPQHLATLRQDIIVVFSLDKLIK